MTIDNSSELPDITLEEMEQVHADALMLDSAIPDNAPINGSYFRPSAQAHVNGLLRHDFFENPSAIEEMYQEWEEQWEEDSQNEDPLAGDVDPTGGYDETEYVDIRDLETNEDADGNIVDGHGNLIEERFPDDEN